MKRLLALILALLLFTVTLVSCEDDNEKDNGKTTATTQATTVKPTQEQTYVPYLAVDEQTDLVIIDVSGYGKIVVELYPETAPITVANFKKLVSEKFYDGLIFHRIIENFMIQGGGYTAELFERPAASIKGEFSANEVENDLLHTRGVISMARANDPDSASSQFFIMHKDAPHLDGKYAAFGMTVYGIEVVDAIATVTTNYYDMPMNAIVINSIRFAKAI
jgi:peptidyl-prolyl cis-trans isomerase B (cyclophilin B)